MTDSDTARAAARPDWMKDWGQFIMLLVALGGFYGFIRSDMSAMESRLGARIDRNAELIFANAEAIARNAEAISRVREDLGQVREDLGQVREDVAHLEGYIRGRLGDDPG